MMNDKLINKDIEKVNLLIDTQDLVSTQSSRSHTNYVIKFDDNGTNNNAGFGGVFRNVIGLRLKSAIIRHDPISLDASNGAINSTSSGGATVYLLKSKYGYYSGSAIADLFKNAANFTTNSNATTIAPPSTEPLQTCAFNNVTQKLTFTSTTLDFTANTQTNNLARVLGFNEYPSTTTTKK